MKERWGWIVCAASFTVHVGIYSLAYCFSLLFVDIQRELNSTAVETGFVGSLIWGVQMFSSPVGSFLESLLNFRAVLILVIIFSSASTFVSSFAVSAKQLLVTIGIGYGLSLGTAWYVMLSVMVRYFPTKNSVRAVSLATTGSAAAMLCISEPVNMSLEAFGWRKTLQFISVFILAVSLPPAFVFSPPKVNEGVQIARPLPEEEYLQKEDMGKLKKAVGNEEEEKQLKYAIEYKEPNDDREYTSESSTSSASDVRCDVAKIRNLSNCLERWKRVATLDTFLYAVFALTCAMSWSVFFVNIKAIP